MSPIPDSYAPHFRKSAFTDPWEPLYSRVTPEQISLGTVLREAHCNSRGIIHGGFISAIADNAMGLSCVQIMKGQGRDVKSLVTVNLSVDFTGMAKVGEWIATVIATIAGHRPVVATDQIRHFDHDGYATFPNQ